MLRYMSPPPSRRKLLLCEIRSNIVLHFRAFQACRWQLNRQYVSVLIRMNTKAIPCVNVDHNILFIDLVHASRKYQVTQLHFVYQNIVKRFVTCLPASYTRH